MDTYIKRHIEIMNQYDPNHENAMIIDEWGTWYDCEPGTNPGFLYQQNTMRDALVAGINLNLFNKNCSRIRMANIAQLVNVLQALILTEGKQMLLTPTYYVFDLYKHHQEATLVESSIDTVEIGLGDEKVPNLTESVSIGQDGTIHMTLTNLSLDTDYPITAYLADTKVSGVSGEIVTGHMQAHNTFEAKEVVKAMPFEAVSLTKEGLTLTIPACSVIHIALTIEQ